MRYIAQVGNAGWWQLGVIISHVKHLIFFQTDSTFIALVSKEDTFIAGDALKALWPLTVPVFCCRASRAPASPLEAWGSSYFTLKA